MIVSSLRQLHDYESLQLLVSGDSCSTHSYSTPTEESQNSSDRASPSNPNITEVKIRQRRPWCPGAFTQAARHGLRAAFDTTFAGGKAIFAAATSACLTAAAHSYKQRPARIAVGLLNYGCK